MYRTTENRRMRNPPCVSCRMSSVVKPTSQLKMNWLHPVVKVTMWIHHFNHIFSPPPLLKGKIPHFQLPLGAAHYGGFTLIPIKLLFGFCYFTFFPVLFFKFQNQTLVVNGSDARTATKSRLCLPPYLHARAPTPQVYISYTLHGRALEQMRSSVNSISMSLP
jgi:hypothetical protein